jgi:hypothetical protein
MRLFSMGVIVMGVIAIVAIVLSSGSSAIAETSEERTACINDAFRFCLNAPPRSQVFNCLLPIGL